MHFEIEDYKKLGVTLCEAMHNILESEINVEMVNRFKMELRTNQELLRMGDDDRSGSDSKPEECELLKEEFEELNRSKCNKTSTATNLDELFNEGESLLSQQKMDDEPLHLNIQSA